jgi:rubrerythrin
MTDKEKQLFVAFKLAMEAERKAQVEYGKLAALAEDPEIRGVFERLEREEAGHEEALLRMYRDFKVRFLTE